MTPVASRTACGTPEWVVEAGWQTSELGAPEADRQLEEFQRVQDAKGERPVVLHHEGEGGAGSGALPRVDAGEPAILSELRMQHGAGEDSVLRQPAGDLAPAFSRPFHAQRECLHRAREHPAGVRVELEAEGAPRLAHGLQQLLAAGEPPGDQVGMAADVFRQRVDADVDAMRERRLKNRPEHGVVADDKRLLVGAARPGKSIVARASARSIMAFVGFAGVSR